MSKKIKYRNLPQMFLKAREDLLRHFRPIITHFGLTEQQWRILRAVSETDGLEQRELSDICQILGPSLTGVLSRMEDMELITRTRMPEDQRRVTVSVTPRGEKLVFAIRPLITEQYRIIEKAFGPQLLAEVYEVMDRFLEAKRGAVAQVRLPDLADAGLDLADLPR